MSREKAVFPYEKKPIARTGRDCLMLCNQVAANMNKMYKYQLGAELCHAATNLSFSIYAALDEMGASEKKSEMIQSIINNVISLVLCVRVAKDVNQITLENFEGVINKVVSIKNQAENWLSFINANKKEGAADAENK